MRSFLALLSGAIATVVIATATPAAATPTFPCAIAHDLKLSAPPQCDICHLSAAGGDAITKPFGQAMLAAKLAPFDEQSLATALATLERDGTDSDGDKTPDIAQLEEERDPNNGLPFDHGGVHLPTCAGTGPQFGCQGRVAATPPHAWTSGVAVTVLGLLFAMRRARSKVKG